MQEITDGILKLFERMILNILRQIERKREKFKRPEKENEEKQILAPEYG